MSKNDLLDAYMQGYISAYMTALSAEPLNTYLTSLASAQSSPAPLAALPS